MMKLLSYLGLPHLDVLNKGGNAKYTSYRVVDELLTLLGDEVKQSVGRQLQKSPCIGLICDETTDLSSTRLWSFTPRLLFSALCKCTLKELPLGEGDASTICLSLMETLAEYGLGIECVTAFGSDGASVITGKCNVYV